MRAAVSSRNQAIYAAGHLLNLSDDFNRADTAVGTGGLGSSYTLVGLKMRIFSNAAQAASYNNTGCAAYRNDAVYRTDNHRVSVTLASGTLGWPMMPHVRASTAGGGMLAYIANSNTLAFYQTTALGNTGSATQRGTGGTAPTTAADMQAGTIWSHEALGPLGKSFYIVRKNGILWHYWNDTSSQFTGVGSSNRVPVVSSYSTNDGSGGHDFIRWEDFPLNYTLPTKMTKSGTLAWDITGSFADITTWTAVNTSTSNLPTFTTILGTNSLTVMGNKTGASFAASIPYTASTAGRTHIIRVVRVSDSAVIATSSNFTNTADTVILNATADVVSGEQYKLQMQGSGASNGTITATTPTFTIS